MKTINDGPVATVYDMPVYADGRVSPGTILFINKENIAMASDKKPSKSFVDVSDSDYAKDDATHGSIPWSSRINFIDDPPLTKYHTVTIDKVENGFIVKIGCKTFVDSEWMALTWKLKDYWDDPIAAEKEYCK